MLLSASKVAETAQDLEGKQAFLDMATAWLILAEQADKNSEERAMGSVQADEKRTPGKSSAGAE